MSVLKSVLSHTKTMYTECQDIKNIFQLISLQRLIFLLVENISVHGKDNEFTHTVPSVHLNCKEKGNMFLFQSVFYLQTHTIFNFWKKNMRPYFTVFLLFFFEYIAFILHVGTPLYKYHMMEVLHLSGDEFMDSNSYKSHGMLHYILWCKVKG